MQHAGHACCRHACLLRLPPALLQGPVLEYDIIGHPQADFHFAVVFPFHSAGGGSVTLIREYAQVGRQGQHHASPSTRLLQLDKEGDGMQQSFKMSSHSCYLPLIACRASTS